MIFMIEIYHKNAVVYNLLHLVF